MTDWRNPEPPGDGKEAGKLHYSQGVQWRLDNIFESFKWGIEQNNFWLEDAWGPKPPTLEDQCARVRQLLQDAPKLIPIHHHRQLFF